ncbi:MAG TPA: hypothetical protein VK879_22860 [Candidatus Sulfomarinibacteraceae bacterium]|nr:hypothetical protein [Candidatus Sulfomarinibacteraceae bacterium]
MFLQIDTLSIRLSSNNQTLLGRWTDYFDGWLSASPAEHEGHEPLSLHLDVRPELPRLPASPPLFRDPEQRVLVFEPAPEHFCLRFVTGAHVEVAVAADSEPTAHGVISPRLLASPQLIDVLYTSLSPLLRRRRYFLTHAAAVSSREGKAALFVGPSQSGKTTSSLALLLHGWSYLASDVVLLREREGTIYAYPTPGTVHVRPYTFVLLPDLERFTNQKISGSDASLTLPASQWATPAPVEAIYFPELGKDERSHLRPVPQAVALGRLIEESTDRWDSTYLQPHLQFLAALVRQAPSQRLQLAHNVIDLPHVIRISDC